MNEDKMISLNNSKRKIEKYFIKFKKFDQYSVQKTVFHWIVLGKLLRKHRKIVEDAGLKWQEWVIDNLPFLKKKRREQCMNLAKFKWKTLKPLWHLGFDRLFYFVNTLCYNRNKNAVKVLKQFGFSLNPKYGICEEEEHLFKKSADQTMEYFKFSKKLENASFSEDKLIDAIKCGAKFDEATVETMLKQNKPIDEYFTNYILNKSLIIKQSQAKDNQESILCIIAKSNETIDSYKKKDKVPEYLSPEYVDIVFEKYEWLKNKVSEGDN